MANKTKELELFIKASFTLLRFGHAFTLLRYENGAFRRR